ncbi:MAG: hypothetical protein V1853_04835 [bacterium]
MMKTTIKLGLMSAVLLGGFFIAQTANALTLIPPSFETAVDPGVSLDTTIKLYNETQNTLQLYPEAVSFTADGETGNPTYVFDELEVGAATWFDLPTGPVTLGAGERIVIPITINPPADAEPGGHYVTVFFGTEPPDTTGSGSVSIGTKLGSLFLLRVFGDVEEAGTIVEFLTEDGATSFNHLPVTLFTRFQNTGNIHLRPAGNITIKNILGGETAVLEFNPNGGATLPDTIRRYENIWEKAQITEADGNIWSDFWTGFSNEWNNFALGRYTATVDISAGNGSLVTDSASVSIWIWPWRVLTIFFIALVIVILLLIFFIRRYNKWIISKVSQGQNNPPPPPPPSQTPEQNPPTPNQPKQE